MPQLVSGRFCRYFATACAAAVVDVIVTALLFGSGCGLILSNIAGNIHGLVIQYFASSRFVFRVRTDLKSFLIHFLTFVIGLALCNGVIWIFYNVFETGFFISKMASIGIPFFFTYNMRVFLNRYANHLEKAVQ